MQNRPTAYISKLITACSLCFLVVAAGVARAEQSGNQSEIDIWESLLKKQYFKDAELIEGTSVIELNAPYRAEDAALTPISIRAKIPQTPERYIEKLYFVVDKNPDPLVGIFTLSPNIGKADLAMRIRVDEYTNVRAIAVLNTGEHHLSTKFVKSQGGCSAPLGADLKEAMKNMGQMKFRAIDAKSDEPSIGQFLFSHPNITGMQRDQITGYTKPAHFVKNIKIFYNDQPVMTADVGISISADPSLRFFFKPRKDGTLRAEVKDSKGNEWTETFNVTI